MNTTTLIVLGVFVLLLWLHVAFFDRIHGWQTPWDRWFAVPQNMLRVLKGASVAFAVVVSTVYALLLAVTAAG